MPDYEPHPEHHLLYDIAERTNGSDKSRPTPHIGPGFEDYQQEWRKTVGEGHEEWWAEVRRTRTLAALGAGAVEHRFTDGRDRWPTSTLTGSHLSRRSRPVDSSTVTFSGCKCRIYPVPRGGIRHQPRY